MLNEEELKDAALLVFANKQDQPGAKGAGEISEALQLGELRDRNWSIMACSAVDGSGVNEGMDWLVVSLCSWRSMHLGRRIPKRLTTNTYFSKPSTKTTRNKNLIKINEGEFNETFPFNIKTQSCTTNDKTMATTVGFRRI